jgi:hypothetical protein
LANVPLRNIRAPIKAVTVGIGGVPEGKWKKRKQFETKRADGRFLFLHKNLCVVVVSAFIPADVGGTQTISRLGIEGPPHGCVVFCYWAAFFFLFSPQHTQPVV